MASTAVKREAQTGAERRRRESTLARLTPPAITVAVAGGLAVPAAVCEIEALADVPAPA
jgi:hypothetical protein